MQHKSLKLFLDNLHQSYSRKYSSKDPVWNLHRFTHTRDIEILGLITSAYSYGSVDQINRFISSLLQKIGDNPYEFTINFQKRKDKKYLENLYYRFNTQEDLTGLFSSLNKILIKYSSLQNAFVSYLKPADENIIPALKGFVGELHEGTGSKTGKYFGYLIPSPLNGSTCKRMNLYLRWMIRQDEIDLGIWQGISRSMLIMPVDTHIARISKRLQLVSRKSIDLKFAIELTNQLKEFDPRDPVKYDFALCHAGIDKVKI